MNIAIVSILAIVVGNIVCQASATIRLDYTCLFGDSYDFRLKMIDRETADKIIRENLFLLDLSRFAPGARGGGDCRNTQY